jgi:hypothetical protein
LHWLVSPPACNSTPDRKLIMHLPLTGKNVAMAEIYKFIPKLFREYDVRLENPNKPWKEEGSWFVKQTGVEVIFTRRNAE